jgi:hypothetical protein
MVQDMKENGMNRLLKETVKVIKYGQMVHYTKVIGETTKQMVQVD